MKLSKHNQVYTFCLKRYQYKHICKLLLEQLNERGLQKFAQGGFVLDSGNSNPIFMGNTSFDDSRIIDALERRDTTPLRAYVFEKEITDAQDIERRLQELSKL